MSFHNLTTTLKSRPVLEALENRRLLSASGLDTSFAQNGLLPGYGPVIAVQGDGAIVAKHGTALVGLNPDGTVDKAFNAKTFKDTSGDLIQSDGKRVAFATVNSQFSISRYLPNGTLDKTFGVNGLVTTFLQHPTRGDEVAGVALSSLSFRPKYATLQADAIIVAGDVTGHSYRGTGIQRLTANGKIDNTFGLEAANLMADVDAQHASGVFTSKNKRIYVNTEEEDGDADMQAFDPNGHLLADQRVESWGYIQKAAAGPDGTITVLCESQLAENVNAQDNDFAVVKRFDASLNLDTTFNGTGEYDTRLNHAAGDPTGGTTNIATNLAMSPDGKAVVSIIKYTDDTETTVVPYLLEFTAHRAANTGDISGFIFNDANSNKKRDAGEAPLRYWQAYADLNNDGIWNVGEPTAYADYNGYYKIIGLAPGHYIVREVRQTGWTRTTPAGVWPAGFYSVTVAANHVYGGNDFGNMASH